VRQLDFLRFWAAQNEIAKEAEVPPVELYAHIEGDSWDYVLLRPVTTPEQDKALEEIAVKRGVKTGVLASLAFREFLTSHTDTLAAGPGGVGLTSAGTRCAAKEPLRSRPGPHARPPPRRARAGTPASPLSEGHDG
jgi:hypothetical protein